MIPNPGLVHLMLDGMRNAEANGHGDDLSKMSDLDIGTGITKGIPDFAHYTPADLTRAVQDARRLLRRPSAPIASPMQQLQQAIASVSQEGGGTKFTVQPLPQPGEGCRERFVVHHSYANGVPISATEVAVTNGGQIVAVHPKLRWDDDPPGKGEERRSFRDLLGAIFEADSRYVEYMGSRPLRR